MARPVQRRAHRVIVIEGEIPRAARGSHPPSSNPQAIRDRTGRVAEPENQQPAHLAAGLASGAPR